MDVTIKPVTLQELMKIGYPLAHHSLRVADVPPADMRACGACRRHADTIVEAEH